MSSEEMKKYSTCFVALFLVFLFGCANKSEHTIKVAGDSVTPATQIASVTTRLTHTRDTALIGSDTTTSFATRDTVYAFVKTENATQGSNIYGKWFYLETGQKVGENTAPLRSGTNFSHFDLINKMPWPQGRYELLVFLDRDVKDSVKFSIVDKR